MGKSRKKKQKSADFQKVKLKVGKRKPLGTNVTDTSFQTATIQIATQLNSGSEPLNRKNLSLKDLLTQLNHYNINIRHEALDGLRDLFQRHPKVMHEQLSDWISKVFIKITDTDPGVRNSLNLCLSHVFLNLLEIEVSPFFKVMMAYISCGLTHLNEGVQLDTLDILGIILDRYPTSFIPFSKQVFENVIGLISKQSASQTKGSKVFKGIAGIVNRQLSVNAEGCMSTIKTRTKILEKLFQIIKIFREPHKIVEEDIATNKHGNIVYVSEEKEVFVKLYKCSIYPVPVDNVELETWLDMDKSKRIINETGNMQSLIINVFPVILNIWVEYEPNKLSSMLNDSHSIHLILPGMKIIIDILDMLLDPLQECATSFHNNVSLLLKSFFKELSSHFLNYFILPLHFSKASSVKSIKQGNPDAIQKFSIDFNFLMAKIICCLLRQPCDGNCHITESKQRLVFIKQLNSFISLMVDSNNLIVCGKKIIQLMKTFDDLLHIKISCDKKETDIIDIGVIFKKMLEIYKMACLSSPWKIPLIHFFSKYVSDEKYMQHFKDIHISQHMKGFMECLISNVWTLPASSECLIKESLDFMKLLLVRKLADNDIIANIVTSMVEMTNPSGLFKNLNENLQRCLIEIVYHINIPTKLFKNLALLCHLDTIGISVKKYLISIVGYCTQRGEKSLELERYVSFILTVVVGFSIDELQKFNVESPNSVSWSILNIFPNIPKAIPVDYAIAQLEQLNGLHHALSLLVPVIGRFLIQLRKLPVTTAAGLIKILEHFSSWQEFRYGINGFQTVDSEINQIADLLSAILLYSVSETYKRVTKVNSDGNDDERVNMEDDLISSSINLLLSNQILLRLLIKKWINVLGEYKMNANCVNSIVEMLIVLLQDPKLLPILGEFKGNIQSIVNAFYQVNIPYVQHSLIEQLKMQVELL